MEANNQPKPMQLLAFRDRGGRELLAEALIDDGLEVEPATLSPLGLTVRRGNPLGTAAFRNGDFYIQDEASQAAALMPPPRPGERVLDAAAAPGGKSFSLIASEPGVRVTASDVSLQRALVLRSNLRRLRRPLPLLVADAGKPPLRESRGPFDRVILDLPCTGTGTLRRHPELKWRISEGEIGRLTRLALRLLEGGAPLVAPGGVLVAITCSLEREENEDVVARFLSVHSDFAPERLEGVQDGSLDSGGWRVLSSGDHDGFTVHVLRKARV
jgi:16S rRNA (cytosine967-C5)-methyltransferase